MTWKDETGEKALYVDLPENYTSDGFLFPTEILLERIFFHTARISKISLGYSRGLREQLPQAQQELDLQGNLGVIKLFSRAELAYEIGALEAGKRGWSRKKAADYAEKALRNDAPFLAYYYAKEGITENPDSSLAWHAQIRALIALSLHDEALDKYDLSAHRLEDTSRNRLLAAQFRIMLGQLEEARLIIKEVLHKGEETEEARILLAHSYLFGKDYEKTIKTLEELPRKRKPDVRILLFLALAHLNTEAGKGKKAGEYLTRVLKYQGYHTPEALFHLARLRIAEAKLDEGLDYLDKSLTLRDSPGAREARAKIHTVVTPHQQPVNRNSLVDTLPVHLKGNLEDLQMLDEWISVYMPEGELVETLGWKPDEWFQRDTLVTDLAEYLVSLLVTQGDLEYFRDSKHILAYPGTKVPIDIREFVKERMKLGAAADPGEGFEPLAPRPEAFGVHYASLIKLQPVGSELNQEIEKELEFSEKALQKMERQVPNDLEIFTFIDDLVLELVKDKSLSAEDKTRIMNGLAIKVIIFAHTFLGIQPYSAGTLVTLSIDTPIGRFFPAARAQYLLNSAEEGEPDKLFIAWRVPFVLSRVLTHYRKTKNQTELKKIILQYLPELQSDERSQDELASALSSYNA